MRPLFRLHLRFLLRICLCILLIDAALANSQTNGTVVFEVTTVSFDGKYAPKNVGAIWVEDAQNNFVKTLKVWANKREKHLIKWRAASGGNTVDAVTSATIRKHGTHSATWDCTDFNGNLVADGNYKIYIEFTETNSASDGKPPGKWTAVQFTKGPTDQTVLPQDEQYFKNIKLTYTAGGAPPAGAAIAGTVLDAETGDAIQGATVQVRNGGQVIKETSTNAAGSYAIADLQAGTYILQAEKTAYESYSEEITLAQGEQLDNKTIRLAPVPQPASLSGNVVDANTNAPVAGATVQLQQNNQTLYEAQTSAAGEYRFNQVTPGNYALVIRKAGYVSASQNVQLVAGQELSGQTTRLMPVFNGATLSGIVNDSKTGTALPGVKLQLKRNAQVAYETFSSASGAFEFKDIEAGAYQLLAIKSGYANWSQNISLTAGETRSGETVSLTPQQNADTDPPQPPTNIRVQVNSN